MKKRCKIFGGLCALLLCCAVNGVAQTRVTLRGRVLDETGVPVGGVQVKLEHEGGPTFSAVSEDTGIFLIANMPEGDYTAHAEKQGFFILSGVTIHVTADSGEFAFTLNHQQEIHENVDVTVKAQRVDPTETAQTATLSGTDIREIPVPSSHDLQQSLIALPQVLRDNTGLLHIAGSRNSQALYLLDGFEIGDPVSGQLTGRLSVDAVRTAEVQTGRFAAEYAHPGAAVLALNTPEGDDRLRFVATDFIPGINIQEGVRLGNYYPRFSLSGPVVKGKFWYSENLSVQHTLSIARNQPPGDNITSLWGGDSLTRFLWHVSSYHTLHGSFLYNKASDSSLGLDSLDPQSTTLDLSSHRVFGSIKDQLLLGRAIYEIGVAVDDGYQATRPQGTMPYKIFVNGTGGNFYQAARQEGKRLQAFVDGITTELRWHGTHTFAVGANVSALTLDYTAVRGEIEAFQPDGIRFSRTTTFSGPGHFGEGNTLAGGFAQDTWTMNKYFVAQLGVRTDWDRLTQTALAEPRVALNFLPFRDNRGKFSVGWGIYDIPLNLSVIGQTADQQQVDTFYDASGNPIGAPVTSRFVLPAGGLRQPYFMIASAGWQQRIGTKTLVSVELLARDELHGLVFLTLTPGAVGSDFLLESTRRDKYRGVTFSGRHTFENGAVLFGSYTRSRASSDQLLDPTLGMLFFAPQQPGPLAWDAPHRFLSWGSVPTNFWDILFSYLLEYRTGYPYSEVNQQQLLIGAPNAQRFPGYTNMTVGLEKKFLFGGYAFALRGAVVNLFGNGNPVDVVNNVDAPNRGAFSGGQGRAVTGRIRFLGRK